jgi:hypothetical protein
MQLACVMHIPADIVDLYYANTAYEGACAMLTAAQARQFAISRDEAIVTSVTTDKARKWFKQMVKPLIDICGKLQKEGAKLENMPEWRRETDSIWKKYGLMNDAPIKEVKLVYVKNDYLVEMCRLLELDVNFWHGPNPKAGGDEMGDDTTAFTLWSMIRRGNEEPTLLAGSSTLKQLQSIFSEDGAVNVLQTDRHFFICPDTSVNESLKATIDRLVYRWSNEKWRKVMRESRLPSKPNDWNIDINDWDIDERTIMADSLMVRRRHISDVDEVMVDRAFNGRDNGTVLIERFNVKIYRSFIKRLRPEKQVNDELISYYMEMLQVYDRKKERKPSKYWHPFIMSKFVDEQPSLDYSRIIR